MTNPTLVGLCRVWVKVYGGVLITPTLDMGMDRCRCRGTTGGAVVLTVLEDPLHVEAVGGAGLVVGAALQVVGQLARAAVVDDPGVGRGDGVWWGGGRQRLEGPAVGWIGHESLR